MKITLILINLIFLLSCKEDILEETCTSCGHEEEMERSSKDYALFRAKLIVIYSERKTNPILALKSSEKLMNTIMTEEDPNNLRWNKLGDLYDFRMETYYQINDFTKCIETIQKEKYNDTFITNKPIDKKASTNGYMYLAGISAKNKELSKARLYIDSMGHSYFLFETMMGTYHEMKNNINLAKKQYLYIIEQNSNNQDTFYTFAKKRLAELEKENPKLMTELFISNIQYK